MTGYKPIMEEALEEVRRSGRLRIQEKVFATPSDPLADLVARFSAALLEKLRAAEKKYGRKDDWLDPNWESDCQRQLLEHVAKGDPRDVAAYAAFCWHHGWPTSSALAKCEDCGAGPCESCMNSGYQHPERAELALAADELAKLPGDVYWLLAKGRTRHDEPLWAIQLTDLDANKLAEVEGDHPADCVRAAASTLSSHHSAPQGE